MKKSALIHRLVIATHNKGKLREFAEMLSPFFTEIVAVGDLGLPEPEETGQTFTENAIIKARAAAEATHSVALADDSGLCVSALNGEPGIYSARWGGPAKDFTMAMQRVQNEMGSHSDTSASFHCTLALAWPDGEIKIFEGSVEGNIVWPPRGTQGHGYDPFFVPANHVDTFAEMSPEDKHAISHRGQAVHRLLAYLRHP